MRESQTEQQEQQVTMCMTVDIAWLICVSRFMKVTITLTPEDAAEWSIRLYDATGSTLFDTHSSLSQPDFDFFLEGAKPKELKLEVYAPIGSAFKDRIDVKLEACLVEAPSECDHLEFSAEARQSILALKTSIGHEKDVADGISARAKSGKSDISAILSPTNLRGYVLIEGMPNAVKTRQVDAVIGSEPWPTNVENACGSEVHEIANSTGLGSTYPLTLMVTAKLAAEKPEAITAALKAIDRAIQYMATNHDAAVALCADKIGLTAGDEEKCLSTVSYGLGLQQGDIDSLGSVGEFLVSSGKISALPDIGSAVDHTYLQAATA